MVSLRNQRITLGIMRETFRKTVTKILKYQSANVNTK